MVLGGEGWLCVRWRLGKVMPSSVSERLFLLVLYPMVGVRRGSTATSLITCDVGGGSCGGGCCVGWSERGRQKHSSDGDVFLAGAVCVLTGMLARLEELRGWDWLGDGGAAERGKSGAYASCTANQARTGGVRRLGR